jgi:phospholipid/cholesterol/gamma-HCH transport system permease protein
MGVFLTETDQEATHNAEHSQATSDWSLKGVIYVTLKPFIKFYNAFTDIIGLISVALAASQLLLNRKRRQIFGALFFRQLYNTGINALYPNGAVAVLIGALLMARLFEYMPRQMVENQFGYLFMVIVFRELGPLISGVILIARSATAVTSEIGYLRLRREFQVLNGLGISPVFLFLFPVFIAFPVSLLLMFIYFDIVVFLSAYFVIWLADPDAQMMVLLLSILDQISINEIAINLVKALLGGMLIGVISIHFGAKVEDSFSEVSEAISNSTTTQLLVFFVINVLLSLLAYTQ